MAQDDSTGIIEMFELLLEKLKAEMDAQNKLGAKAFERGDLDAAQHAVDRAVQLTSLIGQVTVLRDAWVAITILPDPIEVEQFEQEPMVEVPQFKQESVQEQIKVAPPKTQRSDLGRLPRGVCTPRSAYRQPILQTLVEMGGSGHKDDVLTRVEQIMRSRLKPVDYQPLQSDGTLRWSKSAQWTRNQMAREGLLKSDSSWGVWEISEAGRQSITKGNC